MKKSRGWVALIYASGEVPTCACLIGLCLLERGSVKEWRRAPVAAPTGPGGRHACSRPELKGHSVLPTRRRGARKEGSKTLSLQGPVFCGIGNPLSLTHTHSLSEHTRGVARKPPSVLGIPIKRRDHKRVVEDVHEVIEIVHPHPSAYDDREGAACVAMRLRDGRHKVMERRQGQGSKRQRDVQASKRGARIKVDRSVDGIYTSSDRFQHPIRLVHVEHKPVSRFPCSPFGTRIRTKKGMRYGRTLTIHPVLGHIGVVLDDVHRLAMLTCRLEVRLAHNDKATPHRLEGSTALRSKSTSTAKGLP